jgi:hypothetical protein
LAAVRVHTNDAAAAASRLLGAKAFTSRNEIYFARDAYRPASGAGLRLLGHELAHVLQQRNGRYGPATSDRESSLEAEAGKAGLAFESATPFQVRSSSWAADAPHLAPQDPATGGAGDATTTDVTPTGNQGADPLQNPPGGTGKFADNFQPSVSPVNVPVRANAQEFVNNVQARFGDEGGHTAASLQGGSVTPSVDAAGNITGLTLTWVITETVPSPNYTMSSISDTEKNAVNALAARIKQHEDGHAAREKSGRTGFAQSQKGKPEKDLDAALKALECKVGATQRAFDNLEGKITLDSGNNVVVSGVDHPEYVAGCGTP